MCAPRKCSGGGRVAYAPLDVPTSPPVVYIKGRRALVAIASAYFHGDTYMGTAFLGTPRVRSYVAAVAPLYEVIAFLQSFATTN